MKYRPSLPEHNDNVSHDRPVREFFLLFFAVVAFVLAAFWSLGLLVDSAVEYISPEMEAKLFSAVSLPTAMTNEIDNTEQEELQHMVDSLRECVDISYPVQAHLVYSEEANAMAFFGGRIVVLSSLFDKVQSENGLAFILAHELAHFKNRDHLRGVGRGIVLTALMAFLTGSGSDITQLFVPAISFEQAQHSQHRENMADQQALEILNCRYGHVGGATEFFEAMKPDEEEGDGLVGRYFSSHPEAVERIENLKHLSKKMNFRVEKVQDLSFSRKG